MEWDDKKNWVYLRKDLYRDILTSPSIPVDCKQRVCHYPKGLWETPKTFVDGYAYNDGTWLMYNTFRKRGGKLHYKVMCKTKKDVVDPYLQNRGVFAGTLQVFGPVPTLQGQKQAEKFGIVQGGGYICKKSSK